jgi:hypothetical protein
VVNFLDPITKYGNVQYYMFNIRMLKGVFDPLTQCNNVTLYVTCAMTW